MGQAANYSNETYSTRHEKTAGGLKDNDEPDNVI